MTALDVVVVAAWAEAGKLAGAGQGRGERGRT